MTQIEWVSQFLVGCVSWYLATQPRDRGEHVQTSVCVNQQPSSQRDSAVWQRRMLDPEPSSFHTACWRYTAWCWDIWFLLACIKESDREIFCSRWHHHIITISEHRTLSDSHPRGCGSPKSQLVGGLTVTVTFFFFNELVILFSV